MKNCPFCAEQIQEEAIVCRHCNRELVSNKSERGAASSGTSVKPGTSRKTSRIVAYGGGFIILVALFLMWATFNQPLTPRRTTSPGRNAPSLSVPNPVVTMQEFNQLQTGMTYEQAVQVIGGDGVELSRNDLGGTTTVMYQWMNRDGSNMNAMFQNGAMISKAQFRLR